MKVRAMQIFPPPKKTGDFLATSLCVVFFCVCVWGGGGDGTYTVGYVTSPLFTHRIPGTVSTVWVRTCKEHPEKTDQTCTFGKDRNLHF